jgi:hypothetical protein
VQQGPTELETRLPVVNRGQLSPFCVVEQRSCLLAVVLAAVGQTVLTEKTGPEPMEQTVLLAQVVQSRQVVELA